MSKGYLKRYVAPKSWTLLRKTETFVVRPNPGAHPLKLGMPIALLLRQLGYAKTAREIKKILNIKEILVDKRRVKEHKFPVGFMDVLSIPSTKENFRILLDAKGKLKLSPIKDESEAGLKLCRITGKRIIKKGKIQLNMSGNRNLLVEKNEYKPGDSIMIELPSQKIAQHIKLENGSMVLITGGTHIGSKGVIESVEGDKVIYLSDNEKRNTLKKYAFVIGKEKELINL
jgi:small subunit ribosomal protein S4e